MQLRLQASEPSCHAVAYLPRPLGRLLSHCCEMRRHHHVMTIYGNRGVGHDQPRICFKGSLKRLIFRATVVDHFINRHDPPPMKLDEHPIQTFHTRLSTLPRRYHVLICLILLTITCAYLWDIPLHRYFVYGLLPHPDSQTSYIHILQPIHMPNVNTDASSPTYTLDSGRTLLYAASRDSHEKYARAWGHSYTVDDSDYVADRQRHGGVAGNRLMNKLLALQRVLEGELDEPEWSRNDWIL